MVEASCFQASNVGVEGTEAGLAAGPSRQVPGTVVPGGAGGGEGAKGGLVSAAEAGKEASELPFTVPPSVRKWKLEGAGEGASVGSYEDPWQPSPSLAACDSVTRPGPSTGTSSSARSPVIPQDRRTLGQTAVP